MIDPPQPTPQPVSVPDPEDVPHCGTLHLTVDVTDVTRRIYQAREVIPVPGPGPMTLLYPKWLPGFHAPQAPIELFAGLVIKAGDREIPWKRHPVTVNAFHVEIPEGIHEIEATFQFLSPTEPSQGRVIVTPEMLALQWNTVVLYPAGHFARQITVEASLTLPEGWQLPVPSISKAGTATPSGSSPRRSTCWWIRRCLRAVTSAGSNSMRTTR